MKIYDISRTLREGMAVWPGDPEFQRLQIFRIREGATSNVSALHMCVHTGTHLDAPLHLDDGGGDITNLPLQRFIGAARVFHIPVDGAIHALHLAALDWRGVKRVLLKTASVDPCDGPFNPRFAYLHEDAAEFMAEQGIWLAGTDAPSLDVWDSTDLPAHRLLLDRGIALLEGLRLVDVPPGDYELICLPLKLEGAEGSPVRAILRR